MSKPAAPLSFAAAARKSSVAPSSTNTSSAAQSPIGSPSLGSTASVPPTPASAGKPSAANGPAVATTNGTNTIVESAAKTSSLPNSTSSVPAATTAASSTIPKAKPKFNIFSGFQNAPGPPSPEATKTPELSTSTTSQASSSQDPATSTPALAAPSTLPAPNQPGRSSASTYDPTSSPRPAQPTLTNNVTLPGGSTRSSYQSHHMPYSAGQSQPPSFYGSGPPGHFAPNQSTGKSQQNGFPSTGGGNRGGFNSSQGRAGVAGNRGFNAGNNPVSPRQANSPLPQQASPQAFPPYYAAGPQSWPQQPGYPYNPAAYAQYGQFPPPPHFGQSQSPFQGSGTPHLAAAQPFTPSGSPSLTRTGSTGPGSNKSPTPSSTSITSPQPPSGASTSWQPSASTTNPSSLSGSPALSNLQLPNSTAPSFVPASQASNANQNLRSSAASMNPNVASFAPTVNWQPAKKSAAIAIRRPPAAAPTDAPASPAKTPTPVPVPATAAPAASAKDAADAKAKEDEAKRKQEEDEQARLKKEANDARAVEEAEAKAKALAKEAADKKAADERLAQEKKAAEDAARIIREAQEKAAAEKQAEAERLVKEVEAERERAETQAAETARKAEQAKKEEEEAQASVAEKKASEQVPVTETASAPLHAAVEQLKIEEATSALPSDASSVPSTRPSSTEPLLMEDAKKPSPLDLSHLKDDTSAESPQSANEALKSAKFIEDIRQISYPSSIQSPVATLNASAEPGKFRYDRTFLLQFMELCKDRPEQLPALEAIGMLEADTPAGQALGGRSSSQYGSRPLGKSGSIASSPRLPFQGGMGSFQQVPKTSQERFAQSSMQQAFGARPGAPRAASMTGGMGGRDGRRSERGKRRGAEGSRIASAAAAPNPEAFTSLQQTENAWQPGVQSTSKAAPADPNSPEIVQRKVKALLNKLTVERFESISNQILEWANKSEQETDGRILRQVIALIFEKATDEAAWSEMYARLCRKLQDLISASVTDLTLQPTASNVQPVSGGSLFRKYLLNRCQEDFESGWSEAQKASKAAAAKASEDQAKKEANEKQLAEDASKPQSAEPKEAELLSDEYYAAQKAKRRGLGLVRFIGELYKLGMLTAKIMHVCIKQLLTNVESPEEDDMESLCRLLTTVGKLLEEDDRRAEGKAKAVMGIYFERLKQISDKDKVSSRIRFMIQDLMETRRNNWKARQEASGPKTISQIHSDARAQEAEAARRTASSGGRLPRIQDQLSRPNSRRGQTRESIDGWTTTGPTQPVRPTQAGDLSKFGKGIRSSGSGSERSLGSGKNIFSSRGKSATKENEAVEASGQLNPFAALADDGLEGTSPDATERPKLRLAPRTIGLGNEEATDAESADGEEDDEDEAEEVPTTEMDEEAVKRSIDNSVKETFSVRSIEEGVETLKALPSLARSRLLGAFITSALERKDDDVRLIGLIFQGAIEQSLVTTEDFKVAFKPSIETLDDLSTDAPKAYPFMGSLLKKSGLSEQDVRELSTDMESEDSPEEAAEKLLGEFLKKDIPAAA